MDWVALVMGVMACAYGLWNLTLGLKARPAPAVPEDRLGQPTSLPGVEFGMTPESHHARMVAWGIVAIMFGIFLVYVGLTSATSSFQR
jgi:hypothetical protein